MARTLEFAVNGQVFAGAVWTSAPVALRQGRDMGLGATVARVPHNGELAAAQTDTSPRAQARYLERLRAMTPRQRLQRALDLSAQVRARVMADLERSMPGATWEALAEAFLRRVYGDVIADRWAKRHRR
jgi:hypothetical protein